jgi:hypothetical protein
MKSKKFETYFIEKIKKQAFKNRFFNFFDRVLREIKKKEKRKEVIYL